VPSEADRETSVAEKLNRKAADLIASDPEHAESLLRDALSKDLYFGPAHNNLGVVFLHQQKLYEAAHEFEWARKLLPGNPDPRVNLALTLERAGRLEEAFKTYETALEVAPEDLAAIEALASLALRSRRDEPRLRGWLEQISLGAADAEWASWARGRLASAPGN
jgi:tetratricopeptide (TPR) repeat protein